MGALHLVGLRAPDGGRLHFVPTADAPLVLPWWIPPIEREQTLTFYQFVLSSATLPRVEVRWDRRLLTSDMELLERIRDRREDCLLVVRVGPTQVEQDTVTAHPTIASYPHVAIAADCPLEHESLGCLIELSGYVARVVEESYEALAKSFGLPLETAHDIHPLLQSKIVAEYDHTSCGWTGWVCRFHRISWRW